MKKFLALLFAGILFVSPLGCTKKKDMENEIIEELDIDAPAIGGDSEEDGDADQ